MSAPGSWRTALTYALLGELPADGAGSAAETPAALVSELRARHPERLARAAAEPLPYVVPAQLRGDVGPAQLAALLREVAPLLSPDADRPVVADRALDADERRLAADRPPHHGG